MAPHGIRKRRWLQYVAAALIAALAWFSPPVPVSAPVITANAASTIVCSVDGFGPNHGGIWLAKKTIQTHTPTTPLAASFNRSLHTVDTPSSRPPFLPHAHILSAMLMVSDAEFLAHYIHTPEGRAPPA